MPSSLVLFHLYLYTHLAVGEIVPLAFRREFIIASAIYIYIFIYFVGIQQNGNLLGIGWVSDGLGPGCGYNRI